MKRWSGIILDTLSIMIMLFSVSLFRTDVLAQSNSSFYGTFTYSMTGGCGETGTFTIGNELTRQEISREKYIYMPSTGTSISYDYYYPFRGLVNRTVTLSASTIHIQDRGECSGVPSPCWTEDLTIAFNQSYNGGTLHRVTNSYVQFAGTCRGTYDGTFEKSNVDNNSFFGTFQTRFTVGTCPEERVSLTIGPDFDSRNSDNYIYIPKSTNSMSYFDETTGDRYTRTITVAGNSITIDETGFYGDSADGWHENYTFQFTFGDPVTFRLTGLSEQDDLNECSGEITGTGSATGSLALEWPGTLCGGWCETWMGWVNDVYFPWGYHEDFGWIYIFGNDPNNLWFYNQRNNDYWWTTADLWPYIYFYNETGWFYNEPGTNWFVNLNTGQWVQK